MEIKAVLFDLDGTLLPMDYDKFMHLYFKLLGTKLATMGYAPETVKDSVWKGVAAMVKNDGSCKNEEAFWNAFATIYGEHVYNDKGELEVFYKTDFTKVQEACGFHPGAKEVVELVKAKGLKPVLATNPLFPSVATESRMKWAGVSPEDFEFFTTYENSNYCKPNLKYYEMILERMDLKPQECVMVGNDVAEDMIAEKLGMKVFLLTDCLINSKNQDITQYPQGGFDELEQFITKLN